MNDSGASGCYVCARLGGLERRGRSIPTRKGGNRYVLTPPLCDSCDEALRREDARRAA